MQDADNLLTFADREAWRAWLEAHHASEKEAWVCHYKKKAGKASLAYDEAVEEALCFGWIDGLLRSVDGERFALRYSPRKLRSVWSESNKQRVERLIAEGRMTAAGLEKIAQAKANGQWDAATALEDVSADLTRELKKNKAWAAFKQWPVSRQKQYLHWLNSAKKPETRQRRIQAILALALSGE